MSSRKTSASFSGITAVLPTAPTRCCGAPVITPLLKLSPSRGRSTSLCRPPSELKPQAELHLARVVGLVCDPAISAVGRAQIRGAELHIVEGVEQLPAELEAEPLGDHRLLRKREVPVVDGVP